MSFGTEKAYIPSQPQLQKVFAYSGLELSWGCGLWVGFKDQGLGFRVMVFLGFLGLLGLLGLWVWG